MNTIKYYKENYSELLKKYDSANMNELYELILKYTPSNSSILDIGFGSGRDLIYLNNMGYDIWGMDPTKKFIDNIKNIFPDKASNFIQGSLPHLDYVNKFKKKFSAVISIATWMHLKPDEYEESIKNISKILIPSGIVILSYSIGERDETDIRDFFKIDSKLLLNLLNRYNLRLIDTTNTRDSLNRDDIYWETIVLKYFDSETI